MPQLVCTRAPSRASIRWIKASGQLEPPMTTRFSSGRSPPAASRWSTTACHTVCTPAATVTPSSRISRARLAPSVWRPGSTSLAPTAGAANGRPQPLAWNMGTATSSTSLFVRAKESACRARRVCR